ncbi:ATP-binding cassette domain-containing protein [Streptomyces sp. NPDC127084]|uniref:ATP-binding cassette domain-containing protein n=1 Tax=Streptomyces sp. NPDC127084 TaxID=3347133 RepID=UPI00365C3FB2
MTGQGGAPVTATKAGDGEAVRPGAAGATAARGAGPDGRRSTRRSTGRGALRRVLGRAVPFLAPRRRVLLGLAGWSLLESGQTFLGGYGVAKALDGGFLAGRPGVGLGWLAVAAVAVVAGGVATNRMFHRLAELVEPLRDGLVRRVVTGALGGLSSGAGDRTAMSRLTHQTEAARDGFAGLVLVLRSFVFTAAGALLGLLALAPALLLVVLPPLAVGLVLFTAALGPMAARQREFLHTDEQLAQCFAEIVPGLRDVVACGAEERTVGTAEELIDAQTRAARSLARWAAVRTLALALSAQLPIVLLLAAAPWLLRQGVTAGALLGALTYLTQALLPALHTLMTGLGAAGTRLLVILDHLTGSPRPRSGPDGPADADGERLPVARAPRLELRSVSFAYGPGARPVVDALDLVVEPGEHLAVVGPSGIGKSTLFALVAGLLEPDDGDIRLDGVPVRQCPGRYAAAYTRALIPQEAYVFTGSLRENLLYLCPGGASSTAVESAVAAIGLEPVVRRLGGLDAPVGPGALSQGERQLIALTRAYLSPARLVLLDEATCHLDPAAEARAEHAFAARPGTLIVIAHRLTSARRASRVLVLDGVHAISGSHQDLLARSELYRDLVGHWEAETSPATGSEAGTVRAKDT